jgi:hypothetical protein
MTRLTPTKETAPVVAYDFLGCCYCYFYFFVVIIVIFLLFLELLLLTLRPLLLRINWRQ